ncbi:hypothetical protein B0H13DRAFT_1867673 [Mycena leptocephala]|nr:hypothetical protein B0H13DRAFT_1867673 [Mycena leptocephala]
MSWGGAEAWSSGNIVGPSDADGVARMREEGDKRLGDGVLHRQRRVPEPSQENCDFGVVEPRIARASATFAATVHVSVLAPGAKIVPALPDELFGAWLTIMSRLRPTRHYVEARWFRPAQARVRVPR